MSIYETKVYYNDYQIAGVVYPGWYYHILERMDNGITIRSDRGAYDTAEEAQVAMSKALRSREVMNHLAELTLEEKEKLLGL